MIVLKVKNQIVDLYPDETINLNSGLKDYRTLGTSRTDFSNSFTIPATDNNNAIFGHYFSVEYQNSADLRSPITRCEIEIDSLPFKKGYVRVEGSSWGQEEIRDYSITFFGNDVSITTLVGDYYLKDLPWDIYNHTKTAAFVKKGLDGATQLVSADFPEDTSADVLADDVIYPLIQSKYTSYQWNDTNIITSTVPTAEFYPAIRLDAIVRRIEASVPGLIIKEESGTDFFSQPHFNDAYMYCPTELDPDGAGGIYTEGTEIRIEDSNPQNLQYIDFTANAILTQDIDQDFHSQEIHCDFFISNQSNNFTVKEYRDYGGGFTFFANHNSTGDQTFNIALGNNTNVQRIKFFAESAVVVDIISCQFEIFTRVNSGSSFVSQGYGFTATTIAVRTVDYYFGTRMPNMKIADFLVSLSVAFNLVVYYVAESEFKFETYDDWRTIGSVKDFSDNVDITKAKRITPSIPAEIKFSHQDTKQANNAQFNDLFGRFYGNTSIISVGAGEADEYKTDFSLILFDKKAPYLFGYAYDKENATILDEAFIFYYTGTLAENVNFSDSAAVTSHKVVNNYWAEGTDPTVTPTHALVFDSEINPMTTNEEAASLFAGFYDEYFNVILSPNLRIFEYDAYLSDSAIQSLHPTDTIRIGDQYYTMNTYTANLMKDKLSLELFNFIRPIDEVLPPAVDNVPPQIGLLSLDLPPDTEAPTAPTNLVGSNATGTTVDLTWTASTDDRGVDLYDIYVDQAYYSSIIGSIDQYTLTGLSINTEYDVYLIARDEAGNSSLASNEITFTTVNTVAPVITNNLNTFWQVGAGGANRNLQITATNSPDFYGWDGTAPGFLSLNTTTGIINGIIAIGDAGNYTFGIRASNDGGISYGAYKDITIIIQPI